MKRPQPDLNKNLTDSFVAKTGANRKLKRLWGTTTVNGVEVLHARRHYHKESARPANYEKLFKFLKVYNDVKDYKGKGVKSAWFTLNKSNGPDEQDVSSDYITDNLNRMWWDSNDGDMPEDLTLTTTIVISEGFGSGKSVSDIDWGAPKEDLAQYVLENYEALWASKKIVQEGVGVINKGSKLDEDLKVEIPDEDDLSPDDPWLSILSRYALRDTGIPCTIKDVESGIGEGEKQLYNTLVVTLEIPYYKFQTYTHLVQRVLDDLDAELFAKPKVSFSGHVFNGFNNRNEHLTQSSSTQVNYYETEDDIDEDVVTRQYIQWADYSGTGGRYDNYWVRDGGKWYLKADVIDNPKAYGTTHAKLNSYIYGLLDTGYKKKKVSLWKKIVAVIVFIIAVVVAFFYPPAYAASNAAMTAAYAVMVGALVVSLVTLALSSIGMNEWAMAFAWVSKEIEPLVTIANIIMIVNIIGQIGTNVAKQGVTTVVSSITADVAQAFITGLTDIMAGTISTESVQLVNRAVKAYTNVQLNKIESINSRNVDLKAEYDKLAEESEMETDVMNGYMNIYAKPATADWSMYAEKFDLPYERGGGNLSTGNIQKTTKQAMRKADYEESMFDGILFV